jgi:hypothetical protein
LPAICWDASALVADAEVLDDDEDEAGRVVVPETTGLDTLVVVMTVSSDPYIHAAA